MFGIVLVWVGHFRRWDWVRNFWFRVAHLATIGIVAAGGGGRYAGSFVQHWVHKVLFFQLPSHVFTIGYVVFFLAVAASFWFVKPRRPRTKSGAPVA